MNMNIQTYDAPTLVQERRDDEDINFAKLIDILLESKAIVLGVMGAALIAGAGYAYLSQPVYQADSLVQVERLENTSDNVLGQLSAMFDVQSPATAEIEILKSRLVVGQAADDLALYTRATPKYLPIVGQWLASRASGLTNPGVFGYGGYVWGNESIELNRFDLPKAYEGKEFTLIATPGGYELRDKAGKRVMTGKVGQEMAFKIGSSEGRLLVSSLHAKPGAAFTLVRHSRLGMINELRNSLEISEQGRQSGVLSIVLHGANPERITNIVNAIGSAYVQQNTERKAAEAQKSLEFVDALLPQLERQMKESENKYTQFRDRNGTFDLTTEGNLSLNTSVNLQTQLLALQQRRRELSAQFASAHPNMQVVDQQISALQKEIAGLNERIKALPELQQQLLTLSRDVQVNSDLYVSLLNSAQQLRLIKEGKISNVRVVDTAVIPIAPVSPNRPIVLTLSAIIGLILGAGLVIARSMLRKGIQDPTEIERRFGVHVLAAVPHSPQQAKLRHSLTARATGRHVLAEIAPQDPAIESLRNLRTTLQFAMSDAPNNIVLLTSPTPDVGKSFSSVNLAAVLGSAEKRVLLIDTDLRKGYVHRYFGVEPRGGLSELINGRCTIEEVLHRSVMPNVDLITTGSLPANPSEMLLSPSTVEHLEALSSDYDVVLLDAAPVLTVSDAMALAPHAGTVFMVARAEVTTLDELEEAAKRLNRANAYVNGIVFNDFDASSRRYNARYGHYRNAYSSFNY